MNLWLFYNWACSVDEKVLKIFKSIPEAFKFITKSYFYQFKSIHIAFVKTPSFGSISRIQYKFTLSSQVEFGLVLKKQFAFIYFWLVHFTLSFANNQLTFSQGFIWSYLPWILKELSHVSISFSCSFFTRYWCPQSL